MSFRRRNAGRRAAAICASRAGMIRGYGSTSRMLSETGIALLACDKPGGNRHPGQLPRRGSGQAPGGTRRTELCVGSLTARTKRADGFPPAPGLRPLRVPAASEAHAHAGAEVGAHQGVQKSLVKLGMGAAVDVDDIVGGQIAGDVPGCLQRPATPPALTSVKLSVGVSKVVSGLLVEPLHLAAHVERLAFAPRARRAGSAAGCAARRCHRANSAST